MTIQAFGQSPARPIVPAWQGKGRPSMPEAKAEFSSGNLENALFELVRQAVRAEVREILRRNEDRLLSIEEVAQTLSVSKDWIYRNNKN